MTDSPDDFFDGGPVTVPPPYSMAAQVAPLLVDACRARNATVAHKLMAPILDEYPGEGNYALCMSLAIAFATYTGLASVAEQPSETTRLLRMTFDMPNLFGGTPFDLRTRVHTASEFIGAYLSGKEHPGLLDGDDNHVTLHGLCELLAGGLAPPTPEEIR